MVSSKGYRRQTRQCFSKQFRKHGMPNPTKLLVKYKRNDYVDIKADSAVHKGMPHKSYNGCTGKVAVVEKRSLIVRVSRRFGNSNVHKYIRVRVEHLTKSKCGKEFRERIKKNEEIRRDAKSKGIVVDCLKRKQKGPREAFFIGLDNNEPIEVKNDPYVDVF